MNHIQHIIDLITKGKTEKAISKLLSVTKDNQKILSHVQLLSSQYHTWNKDRLLGLTNDNTELNRINLAILNIVHVLITGTDKLEELNLISEEQKKLEGLLEGKRTTLISFKRKKIGSSFVFYIPFFLSSKDNIPIKIFVDGKYIGELIEDEEITYKIIPGIHYIDFVFNYKKSISTGRTTDVYECEEKLNFGEEFTKDFYGFEVFVKTDKMGDSHLEYFKRNVK